jgi:hypothetical protein
MKNSEEIFVKRLEELKKYIDENKKKPTQNNKDKVIRSMAYWISDCQYNYVKKIWNMKDENIYKLWNEFINDEKYEEYFLSRYDRFVFNLNKIKIYINTNQERPSNVSKDKDIKSMAGWIGTIKQQYYKNIEKMKDKNIRILWENFISNENYKKYILLPTMLEKFIFDLNKLKTYIDINKKRPSSGSKVKDIKIIGSWLSDCKINYSKKINNMKDENIRTLWKNFINDEKYKEYFLSQYDSFIFKLNKVKTYIDINKQKPSTISQDKDIKSMAQWMSTSQYNYDNKEKNMKDENIMKLWENFISNEKYKHYFLSQYDSFIINLNKLKTYIDTNNQIPSQRSKDKDIKSIGQWICTTKRNYSKRTCNMKDEKIYKLWYKFLNDFRYKDYFI